MKCLETRRRQGMKWRRYRTQKGATVTTFEVPCEVIRVLGARRLREELERAKRRLEAAEQKAQALAMLASGAKTTAVAHEFGLADSTVRRWAQQRRGAKR